MTTIISIYIDQWLDGYHQEELEDKIRDFLSEYGLSFTIENSGTGNTVQSGDKSL